MMQPTMEQQWDREDSSELRIRGASVSAPRNATHNETTRTHRKMKAVVPQNQKEPHLIPRGLLNAPPPFKRFMVRTTMKNPVSTPTFEESIIAPTSGRVRTCTGEGKGGDGKRAPLFWLPGKKCLRHRRASPVASHAPTFRSSEVIMVQDVSRLVIVDSSRLHHTRRSITASRAHRQKSRPSRGRCLSQGNGNHGRGSRSSTGGLPSMNISSPHAKASTKRRSSFVLRGQSMPSSSNGRHMPHGQLTPLHHHCAPRRLPRSIGHHASERRDRCLHPPQSQHSISSNATLRTHKRLSRSRVPSLPKLRPTNEPATRATNCTIPLRTPGLD